MKPKKPKYRIGQTVRYGVGETAFFKITSINNYGSPCGPRYFGRHELGGAHGAYESDLDKYNTEDSQ